jgi:ATP-dependent DNA ligase
VLPYVKPRALLEQRDVEGPEVRLVAAFDDGEALYQVVCQLGLEGLVAKRERDPYRPGERGWIKRARIARLSASPRSATASAAAPERATPALEGKFTRTGDNWHGFPTS